MATAYVKVKGKAHWARLFDFNKDTKFDDDGVFTVQLYMDKENTKKLKDSGSRLRPRINEDTGEMFYTIRRKNAAIWKGEKKLLGPPKVTLDGNDWEGVLGNGSEVEITLAVYDTAKGKGTRMQEVKILKLVEYVKPDDDGGIGDDDDIPL